MPSELPLHHGNNYSVYLQWMRYCVQRRGDTRERGGGVELATTLDRREKHFKRQTAGRTDTWPSGHAVPAPATAPRHARGMSMH